MTFKKWFEDMQERYQAYYGSYEELLQEAFEAGAKQEREACAKVCDSEKKWWNGMSHSENDIYQAIDNISACIQARGEA